MEETQNFENKNKMNPRLQQSSSTDATQGKQEKAGQWGNKQVKWRSTNQLDFHRSCIKPEDHPYT